MVLSLEQRVFIVNWDYETHSLKRVCDDFILEFPNSVSLSNHKILNLIKNFENKHIFNDLPHSGWVSVVISEKMKVIAKNDTEHLTTSSQLVKQVGLSHTLTYHTLCSIAYTYQISIQHELKPADSPKRAKFCQRLCHYTCGDVSVFDTFFFSNEVWFHLDRYINGQNYRVWSSENPHFFKQRRCIPKKLMSSVQWVANVKWDQLFWENNYCRCIPQYYTAIYSPFT